MKNNCVKYVQSPDTLLLRFIWRRSSELRLR